MNIDVFDLNIYYTDSDPDSGKPVVAILQGWGTGLEVYSSIVSLLENKYRVIAFDFPGFGKSQEPPVPWNVDRFKDFFLKFMETLKIQRATLIGHSYGGRVIIKLAAMKKRDFIIDRIILIDSAGIMPKRSMSYKFKVGKYKLLKRLVDNSIIRTISPNLVEDWKQKQGSADYRSASPIMRQCLILSVNEDLTELLSLVNEEALLIWGDLDTATPITDGELMEKLMPNAGLAVIRGAGHYSFLDSPIVFKNIISSYMLGENL